MIGELAIVNWLRHKPREGRVREDGDRLVCPVMLPAVRRTFAWNEVRTPDLATFRQVTHVGAASKLRIAFMGFRVGLPRFVEEVRPWAPKGEAEGVGKLQTLSFLELVRLRAGRE
jgi:hypothetical protein